MIFALYVICSLAAIVLLSARLRETQAELARVRGESDVRAETLATEYTAHAQGLMMTLACLLSIFAAWRPQTSPSAGGSQDGKPGGAPADGEPHHG